MLAEIRDEPGKRNLDKTTGSTTFAKEGTKLSSGKRNKKEHGHSRDECADELVKPKNENETPVYYGEWQKTLPLCHYHSFCLSLSLCLYPSMFLRNESKGAKTLSGEKALQGRSEPKSQKLNQSN